MREIETIIVRKNGFLIKMPDIEAEESGLLKTYLLKFNKEFSQIFYHYIAEYTRGKPKDETRKCPGEHLREQYNNYDEYKNVLRKCLEDPQRDCDDRPFGPKTLFVIHRMEREKKQNSIDDVPTRKKFFFEFFIHKEKDKKNKNDKKFTKEDLRFWLGDFETTDIKFETEKTVSEYEADPPRGEKKKELQDEKALKASNSDQKTDSIFSNDFREYVRFECRTEDLDHKILSSRKGFGVKNTEKLKEYMIREKYDYESSIRELIDKSRNILIIGSPKMGKTRLAFEVLKNLKGFYVFSLFQKYWPKIDKLKFSTPTKIKNKRLIWFIDNLHYFNKDVQQMYEKLIGNFGEVIVVATLRSDIKFLERSFIQDLEPVSISKWTEEEIEKLADKNSIPIEHEITNSPVSLVKDFSYLRESYKFYLDAKEKVHCLCVLHYLKLLFEMFEYINYTFFENIFIYLREGLSNKDDLRRALTELKDAGFIEVEEDFISPWEIIFTEVVTDEKYVNMICDMVKLSDYFYDRKMFEEMNYIGIYFNYKSDFEIALNVFNKAIELSPNHIGLYNNRAFAYRGKGQFDSALEDYKKVLELDLDNHIVYNNCGSLYIEIGEYDLAIKYCDKAVKISPNYSSARFNRGSAYCGIGKFILGIKDYEKVIELDPYFKLAYHHKGRANTEIGKYELAIKDFNRAIEIDSNYTDAYCHRARAHHHKGAFDLALKDCNEAINLDQYCHLAYLFRGFVFEEMYKYKLAIRDFNKVIELDPNNRDAHFNLGNCFMNIGEYDLAINILKRTIKLDPNYKRPYSSLARCHHNKAEYDLAIKYCDEAIEIDVSFTDPYLIRGSSFYYKNENDSAIKDYTKVIELEPDFKMAYCFRGDAYYDKGNHDLAIKDYLKTIMIDPNNAYAYYKLSCTYAFKKIRNKTLSCLKEAVKLNPKYKKDAKEDESFKDYWDDTDFLKIVDEN